MRDEADTAPGGTLGGDATWRTAMLVVMGLLGTAVLAALIVTLAGANRQRERALKLQTHSYQVMIVARTLSGTIARSEASLGRYVISTDKRLGQIYFDQWRQAESEIDRLAKLTADNRSQTRTLDRLRAAYQTRGDELSLTALSTSYGKNNQALARYYDARNAASLAEIDRTLDQIIAQERGLLAKRTGDAMTAVDDASRIAGILGAFGILIVLGAIALGWLTLRAVGDRVTAEADATLERERVEELETAVTAATSELRIQEAKLRQVQKMEAVGQLTGGIAHDFNNMLAVVLGGLELAKRCVATDPLTAARHIDNATDGANRAAALTRRLLAFSREDALKPEPIRAGGLIAGMSELLDRTLGDAITLITRDESDGWRVRADRVQLENAILNLAVNARDAMAGRGVITVATGTATLAEHEIDHCNAGDYVSIAVIDDGCGMAPEVVERVYEPFFTTKEAGKGTGLGLSQIFGLVRQLDGEITIATAVDQGTTVTLYIPRDLAEERRSDVADVPSAVVTEQATLDILVVEDDPRVLAATIGALDELGHRGIACDAPDKAAAILAGHTGIDLILSDVLMPGQTGPELIAEIGPRFPHIAVVFVTGYAGEANAREFGEHPVLRKPFTLTGLEHAISEAMAADRPAPSEQIAAE
ncbi:ATP-binding protein [Sphingomonas oligophenolica]|uniref:histidine kinase n=1 Tax=Sphingomonas oligophenolica TaxID=301154 RepID=A0A502CN29_9SPHN|nr:ATP-binding protein [Sphingomonas oligophenolica]TPG14607.1 response regulator [Sphingomonas oligophenolica]